MVSIDSRQIDTYCVGWNRMGPRPDTPRARRFHELSPPTGDLSTTTNNYWDGSIGGVPDTRPELQVPPGAPPLTNTNPG